MGPKKSNKTFYIVLGAIGYVLVLLLSCQMGRYETRHPSAELFDVLGHAFQNLFSSPFDIFPLTAASFKYIGILSLVAVFLALFFYVNQ